MIALEGTTYLYCCTRGIAKRNSQIAAELPATSSVVIRCSVTLYGKRA